MKEHQLKEIDEKDLLLGYQQSYKTQQGRVWRRRHGSAGVAALSVTLLCLASLGYLGRRKVTATSGASDVLNWSPCPDVTETLCAYLPVPMNYHDPRPNETVSLALRKLPATAPVKDRLGSLFINPGGPGGSGTSLVVRAGLQLSVILEGRYDILSWDPRAVNLTSPALNCFETVGDANRFDHDLEHVGLPYEYRGGEFGGQSNMSNAAELAWTAKLDAFQSALNGACEARGHELLLRSASTAFVVKDMVSILDALGEEKLNYWGFSYGTILGATFAAMEPDRVQRLILDGVSSAALYTANMFEWGRSGMDDTEKTYAGFFDSCAESGPKGCALATNSSSTLSIRKRVDALQAQLRSRPLAVPTSKVGPGILTSADIQYSIFHALYSPKTWPKLAEALADLEKGNGSLLFELVNASNDELGRKDPFKNPYHRSMESSSASTAAIMCSDTDVSAFNQSTTESISDYVRELSRKSITGEIWAMWVTTCRYWSHKAIETYRGPWTVADGLRKTNFPVLFFSMTADPVTPLSAARSMSEGFGNQSATLLIQNGFGHCSLAHPSLCSAKAARAYFLEGKVPEYGTTCDADPGFLFPHPNDEKKDMAALSAEDEKLSVALEGLSREVRSFGLRPPHLRLRG
ncbi:alpha/beta-hydrolase [Meredithblackwellia eburnea MCA 4105]